MIEATYGQYGKKKYFKILNLIMTKFQFQKKIVLEDFIVTSNLGS